MATITVPQRTIPGPRSLPLLSWRLNVLKVFQNPFTYLRKLHDTYGNVVTLARGSTNFVCAFGPEMNFQLLSNPQVFGVSGESSLLKLRGDTAFSKLMRTNLLQMDGEKHKQHRRLMLPAFHKQQIIGYGNDMIALTEQMLESWQSRSEFNLHREMQQLTQSIAVKTLFGTYDQEELNHAGAIFREMTRSQMLALALQYDIPGTPYHHIIKLSEQLDAFVRKMIARKRAQKEATNDVLSALLLAHDEDGTKLSDDEVVGHAFSLFAAGHETTSNALSWTIFLLDQHPQIFNDLLDELDGTLHGSAPTIEQLGKLQLLDGVVKEGLRLMPPASIGLRITQQPYELSGYSLPKGTSVFYSEFITQRMPELYEEPDRFKPQRWATLNRSIYEYLPFSAGHHMCIGASFAAQELRIVLAMLLQRYRLAVVPNSNLSTNATMRPTRGMPVHVFPQDRQFQRVPVRGNINELVDFGR